MVDVLPNKHVQRKEGVRVGPPIQMVWAEEEGFSKQVHQELYEKAAKTAMM